MSAPTRKEIIIGKKYPFASSGTGFFEYCGTIFIREDLAVKAF
jgi:hypothetical protein